MANIKSQKKRIRTNELSRQRNVAVRSRVKTFVKKAEAALEAKNADAAALVTQAVTEIDRAASKGVFHPNKAARQKSSLMRLASRVLGR